MSNRPPSWDPREAPPDAQGPDRHPAPPAASGPPRPGGRDWRIVLMAVAAVVVALAGVAVYVAGSRTTAPRSPLATALVSTRSAGTADLSMTLKATMGSVSFSVTATGTVDFATHAVSLRMNAFGQAITVVETGGHVYEKLGNFVSNAIPGKTWVTMPVSTFAGDNGTRVFATSDPTALMTALVKLGATVTHTGTTTIDGTQDQGYRLSLTVADLRAHASELPPSLRSIFGNARTGPGATATVTTTMYVDPAGQLQAVHVLVSGRATGHPASATVDVTLSQFGAASPPAAPPGTKTVTYAQLKQVLHSGTLPFTGSGSAGTQASQPS